MAQTKSQTVDRPQPIPPTSPATPTPTTPSTPGGDVPPGASRNGVKTARA
jgi:hypothetical protein